jgi:hypothetical protein
MSYAPQLTSHLYRLGLLMAVLSLMGLSVGCSGGDDGGGTEQFEMMPSQVGERGESCQARNDCKEGLACVRNTCVLNDYAISASSGQCSRIECEDTEECCQLDAQCQEYDDACKGGDASACDYFEALCTCNEQCIDKQCQEVSTCADDTECGQGTCSDAGVCVECTGDDECFGGEQCVQGRCKEGCKTDANCPLFHACDQGECVEQDCQNDRECVLFTEDGDATCTDGECIVPCTNDAECNDGNNGFFEICEDQRCIFVGCETDHECRIALDMKNTDGSFRAVCETGAE